MRILLDTHTFLWLANESQPLSSVATSLFTCQQHDFCLSMASLWEMAIKIKIGKLHLPAPMKQFVADQLPKNGITILPIELPHVIAVADLPLHHNDPFDRLIIAQALVENHAIISVDNRFDEYGVQRLW